MTQSNPLQGTAGNLSLDVIFQQWVVSVIGDKIESEFIRPAWQPVETGYPDIGVNWCSIGVKQSIPDWSPQVVEVDSKTQLVFRHEELMVMFSFFGEDGWELASALRDGLSIWQNRQVLVQNGMDILAVGDIIRLPELVNQQWQNRVDFSLKLRRNSVRELALNTITSLSVNVEGEVKRQWQSG